MNVMSAASEPITWPFYVAAAVLLLGLCVAKFQSSRKAERGTPIDFAPLGEQKGLVYTDAPTVRVGDSQRIDRLHRLITLKPGQRVDLLDVTFDRIPRLRIALQAIQTAAEEKCEYARINIELGGARAGCGSLVKEIEPNDFLAPAVVKDEQPSSIVYFAGQGEAINFLRIKVVRIDPALQSADIDVLHLCGQWAA